MNLQELKTDCYTFFPNHADRLYSALEKLHYEGLCVRTGNTPYQTILARNDDTRGKLFEFNGTYTELLTPNGEEIALPFAAYSNSSIPTRLIHETII